MTIVTSNRTPNEQAALDLIRRRKQAYAHTFKDGDRFASDVLADLSKFCRGGETTFHIDQRFNDVLQGRREVFLRICNHLGLDERELYEKFVLGK
ncbi:MAG: hypothetical protein KDA17_04360 [Candidatus Saccharibacteria bacterium]|nr:hypothetical protein [Candidatus Saccharibacteria bacterium]